MIADLDYFERLHEAPDPWGVDARWYERRKRDLLLACLPQARFARCWEAGCSVGALTEALAARCARVVATDAAEAALAHARVRLSGLGHVELRRQRHPEEWPGGRFDLIVVSELAYYLDAGALARMARRLETALEPGGTLVACHWRWPFAERRTASEEAHRVLDGIGLPRLFAYRDPDLLLEGWGAMASVAQREGLA